MDDVVTRSASAGPGSQEEVLTGDTLVFPLTKCLEKGTRGMRERGREGERREREGEGGREREGERGREGEGEGE